MVAVLELERLPAPDPSESQRAAVEERSRKGDEYFDAGLMLDAIKEYDAAIELSPGDSYLRNNRGAALARLGRLQEALEEFESAIAINSINPMILRHKAFVLFEMGSEREAISALEILQAHPIVQKAHQTLIELVLKRLVDEGFASWAGGKPEGSKNPIKLAPGTNISDYIIEERERLRN